MVRIYLTSEVRIEHGDVLLRERDWPGRQGRVVLAMLVAERDRPIARDVLAEELWGDKPPDAADKALMAIVSKLRGALRRVGFDDAIGASFGCYQLKLPPDIWVDIEAGAAAVHDAEAVIATGDVRGAYPLASVAYFIGRRPFLIGEDGPWARRTRARLREQYLRALDCCVICGAANGELAEARQAAEDALAIEPLRETTYQNLMRALADSGNRAEALRVYERCRRVVGEELGVPPSAATEALYNEILLA